MRRNTKPSD